MSKRRSPEFDLAVAVRAGGFTPRAEDVPALVAHLATEDETFARGVERALEQVADVALPAALEMLATEPPRGRAGIARLCGRLAPSLDAEARSSAVAGLCALLADSEPRVRRHAATALAKLGDPAAEPALLACLAEERATPERRAMVEALGRVGSAKAADALRSRRAQADAIEQAAIDEALLRLARVGARAQGGGVAIERSLAGPVRVLWRCRSGLEALLAEETGGNVVGAGRVEGSSGDGTVADVAKARIALDLAFLLDPVPAGADAAAAAAEAISSPGALAIFSALGAPPHRYRIGWIGGGHRRADTRRVATLVAARRPELVNDPRDAPWEARIVERDGSVRVELEPRGAQDDRFAYRVADVPAASHPTVAAALVRAAGIRADDVVWDPFVGSGVELVERALAGPYAELVGTDLDEHALDAARANIAAAGVQGVSLLQADARSFTPPRAPTLVLTNPPLGRRHEGGDPLASLLDGLVDRVADLLAPGGRFVWISPHGGRTADRARDAGLELELRQVVDMGGFEAELQRFGARLRSRRRSAERSQS